MKQVAIVLLLSVLSGTAYAQENTRIQVIGKGDVFQSPFSRMVVMDERTFGQFYFYRAQYDSLSRKAVSFRYLYNELDSLTRRKEMAFIELVREKDHQIQVCQQAYHEMKETVKTSSDETKACISKINALQRKYDRQSRQNNFWKKTTFLLTGVALTVIIL